MPAYDEETFGPVAAIIGVKNEKQAIQVANDSAFGLGAAVFTRDRDRGERIAANELEAGRGSCWRYNHTGDTCECTGCGI